MSSETAFLYREDTFIHFPFGEGKGDLVVRYRDIIRLFTRDGKSYVRFALEDGGAAIEHIAWNPETAQHEINDQVLHALTPWEHRTDPKVVEMSEAARAFIRSMNES